MISEAQAAEAPRIVIPTRPLEVPPELLELQPDAVVCYSQAKNPGVYLQSTFGTATEAIQLVRDTIARQAAGRFYIFEAAQVLADESGFPAREWLRDMHRAVEDGRLRFRDLTGLPVEPGEQGGEYMTPDDLNSWLEWADVKYRLKAHRGNDAVYRSIRNAIMLRRVVDGIPLKKVGDGFGVSSALVLDVCVKLCNQILEKDAADGTTQVRRCHRRVSELRANRDFWIGRLRIHGLLL